MQLHLEGTSTINAPRLKVYTLLTDVNFIADNLPDADDVHVIDGSTLEARLKLRIAVVTSGIKVRLSIAKNDPPNTATMLAEGTGSGSTMKITSLFTLDGDSPTKMSWSADAEITGVMAGLGSTLLKGFATKKVGEIFAEITEAVEKNA